MRAAASPNHGVCVTKPSAASSPGLSTTLLVQPLSGDGDGSSLRDVRAAGRTCAEQVCPEPAFAEDAVLVVSELVGNALQHGAQAGAGKVFVQFLTSPCSFKVRVLDPSPKLPRERAALDDDVTGRGLYLVRHFAAQYGGRLDVEPAEDGKAVTCTLCAPAPSDTAGEGSA